MLYPTRAHQAAYTVVLVLALLVTLLAATPGWAQESRGTVVGKVTDATGAVIPGASVQVTNKAMGTKITLATNEVGFYQAPFLIPGLYELTVEMQGFKKFVRDDLEVRVNDRLQVDITLQVGAAAESITVTGETPLLSTTTAAMGQVIDAKRVADLPLAHGNPYALIGLAGGVSFRGSPTLDRPFEPTHIVGYAMAGTRSNRSDVMIDGLPSTATANANEVISSYVPPADIVHEFKVQTAAFDASYGNTEGGVINISLKSGTREFHGTAYYAKMTPSLFANNWFANAAGSDPVTGKPLQPRTDFTYNRWGGSAGGPVILPKLYNGKNKTFFMYGYEAIHESRPRNNGTKTVPTEAMKTGNFSQLLALGSQYKIYDPATRRTAAGGRYQQDEFAGNIVPANRITPISKKLLEYWPKPLTAGRSDGTLNMDESNLLEVITYYTHSLRVDHMLGDKQRLAVRGSFYKRDSNYNNYFHSIATGQWFQFLSRVGGIDHVYTINPSTVLNTRYGYNRFVRVTAPHPGARGLDLTTLGFPKALNDAIPASVRQFPGINMTGYQGTNAGGEWRPCDTHTFNITLLKTKGVHALKTGMEFRAYRENDFFFGNDQTGRLSFDSTWTRGPMDNSPTAPGSLGQSVAAFLLGLPSSGAVSRVASYAEQSTNWGFFLQDDWRVNNKLTLNIGLRYEFEGPLTERFNRSVRGFDYSAVQPIEAAVKAKYTLNPIAEVPASQFRVQGGLTFAGVAGQPRALYETPKRNLLPQFGFAYRPTPKTVMRGGYGIYYGFLGQRRGDVNQTGFTANTNFVPSIDSGLSFIATLANPFPSGIQEPQGAAAGAQTYLGQGISFFNPEPQTVYNQRWQLGFQRELRGGWVADLAYVGNRGTHIEITRDLNAIPLSALSTSPARDDTRNNYLTANVPNAFYPLLAGTGLASANVARTVLMRAYPQFTSLSTTTNEGYSWYHSLQTGIQKRFSKGYTAAASYTFSKFMQATELLNAADPRPTEVISDQDTPHRLTVSSIYELPFGQGRRFLPKTNAFVSRIISGWQLQGIYTFQSGTPLGNWGNLIMYGNMRDVRLPSDQQKVERWINTDAGFEKATGKQLVSNVRTFPQRFGWLRTDNVNNIDLSAIKNTQIVEGKTLQFRGDFFNAFNHANFAGPNLTPTSASFGQVSAVNNYARRIQLGVKFLF